MGVSLAVAAVPEGLPAIVTVVWRSECSAWHANVRWSIAASSVETLGSATVICTGQDRHADPERDDHREGRHRRRPRRRERRRLHTLQGELPQRGDEPAKMRGGCEEIRAALDGSQNGERRRAVVQGKGVWTIQAIQTDGALVVAQAKDGTQRSVTSRPVRPGSAKCHSIPNAGR